MATATPRGDDRPGDVAVVPPPTPVADAGADRRRPRRRRPRRLPVGDPCEATPIALYALGDSVMLGAAGNLAAAGFCVDAVQSRAFISGLDQVIRLHAEGRLGQTVVVSLGHERPDRRRPTSTG